MGPLPTPLMAKLNEEDAVHPGIAAGTVIDGRYKVVRPIGQGGNGMVHEVEHLMTGRHLAVKSLIDETGLGRLEQEARASALMKNGHSAKITDMGTNGPAGPYLVMELLEGQSLRGLLDDAGQLPLELTVNIALQVCECLNEAHGLGIIHRDLKPENVFLCTSPWPGQYDVKVLDFGIVKINSEGPIPKSSLTRTGSTVGTPYYMSLEQLRNSSAVDARADVYALGVVLYECLSGRKPFQAETIGDLVYALCSGPPTHLGRLRPDLPTDVCDVVMRTLSINRDERPASMADLAAALLGHGNSAFGLWIRVDGKQPALAPPRPPPTGTITPSNLKAPPESMRRAPLPSSTQVPAPPMGTLPMGALAPPEPPTAPRLDPKATAPMLPADPPKKPQRPVMDSDRPAERDTPTEMYVKDAHGAPPESDEPQSNGDRDTPTRAYRADESIVGDRRPFMATLKSPGGAGDPNPFGSGIPAPTFGGPRPGEDAPASPQWGDAPPPRDPMPTEAPPLDPRSIGIPAGRMSAPNLAMATMPLGSQVAHAGPPKPAWQTSLDGALATVGRLVDDGVKRFKAAPQSTQLAIAIAAGGALLLMMSLFLLLVVR